MYILGIAPIERQTDIIHNQLTLVCLSLHISGLFRINIKYYGLSRDTFTVKGGNTQFSQFQF